MLNIYIPCTIEFMIQVTKFIHSTCKKLTDPKKGSTMTSCFFFQIKTIILLKDNTVKFGVFSIKLFKEQMHFSARRIPEVFRLNIAVRKKGCNVRTLKIPHFLINEIIT